MKTEEIGIENALRMKSLDERIEPYTLRLRDKDIKEGIPNGWNLLFVEKWLDRIRKGRQS